MNQQPSKPQQSFKPQFSQDIQRSKASSSISNGSTHSQNNNSNKVEGKESEFFTKMTNQISEMKNFSEKSVSQFLEQSLKSIQSNDYSFTTFFNIIIKSSLRDSIHISHPKSCQSLLDTWLDYFNFKIRLEKPSISPSNPNQNSDKKQVISQSKNPQLNSNTTGGGAGNNSNTNNNNNSNNSNNNNNNNEETLQKLLKYLSLFQIQTHVIGLEKNLPVILERIIDVMKIFTDNIDIIQVCLNACISLLQKIGSNYQDFIAKLLTRVHDFFQTLTVPASEQQLYSFCSVTAYVLRTLNFAVQELKILKTNPDWSKPVLQGVFKKAYKLIFFGQGVYQRASQPIISQPNSNTLLNNNNSSTMSSGNNTPSSLSSSKNENSNMSNNSTKGGETSQLLSLLQNKGKKSEKGEFQQDEEEYDSGFLTFSSASEISQSEDGRGLVDRRLSKKLDEVQSQLRNYAVLLLQTLMRVMPALIVSNLDMLLNSNIFTKDFLKAIRESQGINFLGKIRAIEEVTTTTITTEEGGAGGFSNSVVTNFSFSLLKANYTEPTLAAALVFEEKTQIQVNLVNTLVVVLDNIPLQQWLAGLEIEKMEKMSSSIQPKSFQIYKTLRNLHFTLCALIQRENDSVLLAQIFQLFLVMLGNSSFYEKLPLDVGISFITEKFIVPIIFQNIQCAELEDGDDSVEKFDQNGSQNKELRRRVASQLQPKEVEEEEHYLEEEDKDDNQKNSDKEENNNNLIIIAREKSIVNLIFYNDLTNLKTNALACLSSILTFSSSPIEEFYRQFLLFHKESGTSSSYGYILDRVFEICCQVSEKEQESTEERLMVVQGLNLMAKLQQNYSQAFCQIDQKSEFFLWNHVVTMFSQFKDLPKGIENEKKFVIILKVIEQVCSHLNKDTSIVTGEGQDESDVPPPPPHTSLTGVANQIKPEESSQEGSEDTLREKLQEIIFKKFLVDFYPRYLTHTNYEIISTVLSIASCIPIEFHSLYMKNLIEHLLAFKFEAQFPSTVKFAYFKTLGVLSFSPLVNRDEKIIKIVFDILLNFKGDTQKKTSTSNFNLMIKTSWALANWCCNSSVVPKEFFQQIFSKILEFTSSPKEKIISNGLRCLGNFFLQTDVPSLLQFLITSSSFPPSESSQSPPKPSKKYLQFQKENSQQSKLSIPLSSSSSPSSSSIEQVSNSTFLQTTLNILCQTLKSKSCKVCWNACVSLGNILRSEHSHVIGVVKRSQQVQSSLLGILGDRSNFQTQIHCIQTLILWREKEHYGSMFGNFVRAAYSLLVDIGIQPYSFVEFRYLATLRHHALEYCLSLASMADLKNQSDQKALVDTFNETNAVGKVFEEISLILQGIWKKLKPMNQQESNLAAVTKQNQLMIDAGTQNNEEMKSQVFNQSKSGVVMDDESMVTGTEEAMTIFQFDFNEIDTATEKDIQNLVFLIQKFSDFVFFLSEESQDLQISFGVYDILQEYAENLNLEYQNQQLLIQLLSL